MLKFGSNLTPILGIVGLYLIILVYSVHVGRSRSDILGGTLVYFGNLPLYITITTNLSSTVTMILLLLAVICFLSGALVLWKTK